MRLLIPVLLLLSFTVHADTGAPVETAWYSVDTQGEVKLKLWFFWSSRCPHCQEARPLVERMARERDWLQLESLQVLGNLENLARYEKMARRYGRDARSVPAFFFCDTMLVGYDSGATTGTYLLAQLQDCRERIRSGHEMAASSGPDRSQLDEVAGVNLDGMSLPMITLVIAGLDAFNPCAFFVLLFLLSLMVHLRSRGRMLLVGGVFVLVSGLVYFLFMAAWLNVFMLFGAMRWVTVGAGLVAILMATLNIKDYFTGRGASLSMSESARSGLIQRMRGLLNAESLPALLSGAVVLAVVANSYELLCTSGLPMVYTRLLTLERLPVSAYYLYLAGYNFVYILPLLTIVVLFAVTLGSRKLQARESRALKLMSGLMMLGLGLILVWLPEQLGNLKVAFGIIATAVVIASLAYFRERGQAPR